MIRRKTMFTALAILAAIGIFGYSFLIENDDKVAAAKINGVFPTPETISNGDYPISRSLFFYIKNSHLDSLIIIPFINFG